MARGLFDALGDKLGLLEALADAEGLKEAEGVPLPPPPFAKCWGWSMPTLKSFL